MNDSLIPTKAESVAATRYDFRVGRPLMEDGFGSGFDTCFVLNPDGPAAILTHRASGRRMTIETDQPGLQVYTANDLHPPHRGVALEAQGFPDSPNRPDFASVVLRPGGRYRQTTIHRFEF